MKGPRKNNGYIMTYHPEANGAITSGRNIGYVYEHRYVMEANIGHKLQDNEVVHHIDGNKLNNHPDNLIWMDIGQHTKLHNRLKQLENGTEVSDKKCLNCGKPISRRNNYCGAECKETMMLRRKKDKLEKFHAALDAYIHSGMNYTIAGKMLGVTNNCIKSRINHITFNELNIIDD